MITITLDTASLARLRLAPSPIQETATWLSWTAAGRRHPRWGDPGAAARFALRTPEVALTAALLRDGMLGRYVPDFLTPKPGRAPARRQPLEDQLQRVRATPAEVVRSQLRRMRDVPASWVDAADRLPAIAATGLARFWDAAAEVLWARGRILLEEDESRRSTLAASAGIGAMLSALHPGLRWSSEKLIIDKPYDEQVSYVDSEIVLVPSFTIGTRLSVQVCDPDDAMLAFPTAGSPRVNDPADAALLGRGRTAVLRATTSGISTTDLSRRLHLAPATVSRHLQVLHGAGLVGRTRAGHQVLYTRTEVGDLLLQQG